MIKIDLNELKSCAVEVKDINLEVESKNIHPDYLPNEKDVEVLNKALAEA